MKRFLSQLVPFVFVGIAIVAFALGIILLAYLFLFGAVVGFILFMIAWIKQKFFLRKTKEMSKSKKSSGRIIDSDDWKKM